MIKVMIADDQELIRQSLQIVLSTHEDLKVVDAVENGFAVLESIKKERPDVILMDIMMPIMDGLTATKEIRSIKRDDAAQIPIIAMTANAFEEDAKKCFAVGMNAHLAKPFQIDKVEKTLVQCIHKSI